MDDKLKPVRMGGQAVMEGVMIKSDNYYTVSVRKGKEIVSKVEKLKKGKSKFFKLPIVRGFFNLIDMMKIGMGALMWSAEQVEGEEGEFSKKEIFMTVAFSILIVIVFFIILPYFATNLLGFKEETKPILFNIIDGLIRIGLFLGYIWGISFMKDIKRIFQYHGAEHMAIHCQEKGLGMNIKNVRKFRTMHPRCGTSFLLLVFLLSVIVFSFVPFIWNLIYSDFNTLNVVLRKGILFVSRISLIPLVAGISYEILRISDKFQDNIIFKIIAYPGILLQKITTSEPADDQIEVAIHSVNNILKNERG
tara:strand:- start:316 stop:1233 length:918 start_codon:yes stop_codon:yes gene_type:complete